MGEGWSFEKHQNSEREPLVRVRELKTPDGRQLQALVQTGAPPGSLELVGYLGADEKTIEEIKNPAEHARLTRYFIEHLSEAGPAWDEFMQPYTDLSTAEAFKQYDRSVKADFEDYLEKKARYAAEYARAKEQFPPFRTAFLPPPEVEIHKKYLAMLENKDQNIVVEGGRLLSRLQMAIHSHDSEKIIEVLAEIGRAIDQLLGVAYSHPPGEMDQPQVYWLTFGAATGGQRLLLDLNKSKDTLVFPAQGNFLSRRLQQAVGKLFKPWAYLSDSYAAQYSGGKPEQEFYLTIKLPGGAVSSSR
jgi:hypothetical protein